MSHGAATLNFPQSPIGGLFGEKSNPVRPSLDVNSPSLRLAAAGHALKKDPVTG
jgi:hypothetical protein